MTHTKQQTQTVKRLEKGAKGYAGFLRSVKVNDKILFFFSDLDDAQMFTGWAEAEVAEKAPRGDVEIYEAEALPTGDYEVVVVVPDMVRVR